MTTIHLVRHGQTNWNLEKRIQGQTESELTDLGQQQAREIGQILKDVKFDTAYSSSSIRAHNTAKHILEHHDLPLNINEQLREIFLGSWEGNLYDDMKITHPEHHQHFWQDPSLFNLPGAESFYDIQNRAIKALESIIEKEKNKTILIVSHGIWIKVLLSKIENKHLKDLWLPPKMTNCCHSIIAHDNSERFSLDNFSIQQYANMKEW
ncbi:MAG: histidine phosphatase family protein [Cellvibrionaceae bacterium]